MTKLKELREPLNTTTNRIIVGVLAGGFVFALIVALVQFVNDQSVVCAPTRAFFVNEFDASAAKAFLKPGTIAYATDNDGTHRPPARPCSIC
jgi:hypothetical protein